MESELTVDEVAEWWRVDVQTVRRWIRNGDLQARRRGRAYFIARDHLVAHLDDSAVPTTTTGSR